MSDCVQSACQPSGLEDIGVTALPGAAGMRPSRRIRVQRRRGLVVSNRRKHGPDGGSRLGRAESETHSVHARNRFELPHVGVRGPNGDRCTRRTAETLPVCRLLLSIVNMGGFEPSPASCSAQDPHGPRHSGDCGPTQGRMPQQVATKVSVRNWSRRLLGRVGLLQLPAPAIPATIPSASSPTRS